MKRELSFLKGNEFQSGFREVRGYDEMFDLLDGVKSVSHSAGVYIIVSDYTRYIYPNGESKVIYIGKADDLHQRLTTHYRNLKKVIKEERSILQRHEIPPMRYLYMKYHGAKVFTFYCLKSQNAKDLESYIMLRFFEKYRSLPVGNGARSFG